MVPKRTQYVKQIWIPYLVMILLSIPHNKLLLTTPSLWRPSVTMVQECMGAIPCSTIAVFQMPNASLTPQTEVSYWTLGRRPKSLKAKKLPPGEGFSFTNFHLFFRAFFPKSARQNCSNFISNSPCVLVRKFWIEILLFTFALTYMLLTYKIARRIGKLKSFIIKKL